MSTRFREAFTLVEIMIVVAVLALLALLATPAFLRARNRTYRDMCRNHQRLILAAIIQFAFGEGNEEIESDEMTGEIILQKIVEFGYVKESDLDCPAEGLADHNDYALGESGGEEELPQVWIECLVDGGHTMESYGGG